MEELGNILHNEDDLSEDQLKKYLSGEANAEEVHAVERGMSDSLFVSDAVEGLQDFSSQKKLDDYVSQLNKNLNQQLYERKAKQERRKIQDMRWTIIAVITILLLCIVAYMVIRVLRERYEQKTSIDIQVHMRAGHRDDSAGFI